MRLLAHPVTALVLTLVVAGLTAAGFFTNNLHLAIALWSLAGLIVLWAGGRAVVPGLWPRSKLPTSQQAAPPSQTGAAEIRPPSFSEVVMLARQFTETSKAIYAFLKKQAGRTNEPEVVAEYVERFDARVISLCLDLIAYGVSTGESLKTAMTPPSSVDEIRWIARMLAITGKGFGPDLERRAQEGVAGAFVRTKRTSVGSFPRIESAVDSYGNAPERWVNTMAVADATDVALIPGDEVTFNLEVSDPDGKDVVITVSPPGGHENANVFVSEKGKVTWVVRDKDISEEAYLFIFAKSTRGLHRDERGIDDTVAFIYRVVPRS